jgi:hypothetical protein
MVLRQAYAPASGPVLLPNVINSRAGKAGSNATSYCASVYWIET